MAEGQSGAGLIVVGASVGGLTAAILAADRGCRVIIAERAKEPGGGAATEPEAIPAAGSRFQRAAGVEDSPESLADDILATTHHHSDPEVVHAVTRESAALVEWLADRCGVPMLHTAQAWGGHRAARLHFPGKDGGASLVAALVRAASRHPRIGIRAATGVESLVRDDAGCVTGVSVRSGRRVPQLLSGRVLLACGGFAANDALVAEHCATVASLPYFGWAGASGESLRLGAEAGAQPRRMDSCLVTPFLALPGHFTVASPLVELGAILVNQAGRRFADETGERLGLAVAVRSQPGRVAYLLFDDRVAAAAQAADPFFAHVLLARTARRAGKIEDLAKQFEIDGEALRLTVETYNANLELGGDPFGRELCGEPLGVPLHAIRVTGARCRTLGGLAVDARARVLDAGGQPIAGLYAVGGAAAGFGGEGCEETLVGADVLGTLALARLAALDVVAAVAADEAAAPA